MAGQVGYTWAPNYKGQIHEFRIHDGALSAEKIKTSFEFGLTNFPTTNKEFHY